MKVALPPELLEGLARRRLRVPRAGTVSGFGEHASRALGPGLEFAEHRAYQPGDDLRRVDPHLLARSGELFVREFEVTEPLALTVLVDMSASMGFGEPRKDEAARRLAGAFAHVGLTGGDRVRLVAFDGRRLHFAPRVAGARGLPRLLAWLGGLEARGAADLAAVARELAPRLPRPGLCLVISDWLFAAPAAGVDALGAARQAVVGVQILAPEELDPGLLGQGAVTLVDVESGEELEVRLGAAALREYGAELERRQEGLRALVVGRGGSWLEARSDADLASVMLRDCARLGLVR